MTPNIALELAERRSLTVARERHEREKIRHARRIERKQKERTR